MRPAVSAHLEGKTLVLVPEDGGEIRAVKGPGLVCARCDRRSQPVLRHHRDQAAFDAFIAEHSGTTCTAAGAR